MRMLLTWLEIQPKRWLVLIGIELFLVGAFLTLLFVMPPYERPSAPDTATGRAPMITAPPAVVKVKAPQESQQAEDERVGNIVYDRVAGPTASLTQEQVIDNTDEPQEVPHIVLPPAPVDDEPPLIASIGETADPIVTGANRREGGSAEVPAGYRRLPIYIIRPDGRIVTTGKTPAGEAATVATPERHVAPDLDGAERLRDGSYRRDEVLVRPERWRRDGQIWTDRRFNIGGRCRDCCRRSRLGVDRNARWTLRPDEVGTETERELLYKWAAHVERQYAKLCRQQKEGVEKMIEIRLLDFAPAGAFEWL